MLKENQIIINHWNNKNKQYYINKGYQYTKIGDAFNVDIKDLTKGSKAKVIVVCDYCGKEIIKAYQTYIKQHDDKLGDCCKGCEQVKIKNTWMKKYGYENVFQSDYAKEKSKQTCLKKYGTEFACQSDEVKEIIAKGLYNNQSCKTSKQQLKICEILKELYDNCELNYPYSRLSLDCYININDCKIDVEYDGWYWHKNKQEYDRKRDEFLKNNGYKILRIKAMHKVPTKEQLQNAIDYLVKGNHSYTEIILDI